MFYEVPSPGGAGMFDFGADFALSPLLLAALWLGGANVLAYLAFALDKSLARRRAWRISERTLLRLAFFGGSPGAVLAQRLLRHKTYKEPFRTKLLGIVRLHAAVVVVLTVLAVPAARQPVLLALGLQ